MSELSEWLERHGLGPIAGAFAANDIDADLLPSLTEEDLKELGLSVGQRRRFFRALAEGADKSDEERVSAEPPRSAAAAESAERRQLTVMFCDLVGSTELSLALDPEELRAALSAYHDTVARVVAAHQGHVAKFLGDGVLAYFGWPRAQEDSAERAVRAGLEAVEAVSALRADGQAMCMRAGIATGPVVIGEMIGDAARERDAVAGATPNLAARLQAAAAPGEVVLHDGTRRLIGGIFALDDRGEVRLKGFSEPVRIWRAAGLSSVANRFDALHGSSLSSFVGRAHEIGLLVDRWREAAGGEGQAVLFSGEAGIGKSRILREFARRIEGERCITLGHQCSPHELNAALHPIAAEIAVTAGIGPDDPPPERLEKLKAHLAGIFGPDTEALGLVGGLLGLPPDLCPLPDMTPQRRRQRTAALLVERVARLAREMPVIVLAEDLHWADPSTLEVFDALIDTLPELPVLVVATARPEFSRNWSERGHVTFHSLNRLGRGAGRAIAEAVAGAEALPKALLDRIVAQTDGVPLFVEELTKSVLEAGLAVEEAGQVPLSIPATLQDSLMARLDRLAPVKRVVQAASCIGREFEAGLLGAALGMEDGALAGALDELVAAQLIFRRHGGAGERFLFKHALVQDAAYASLLKPARRSLHERIAGALEAAGDGDPLELARHWLMAGAHEKAARHYLSAGQASLAASALPEAIGALELGLEAMAALDPSRGRDRLELDLRLALGTARMANFGWAHPSVAGAMEPAFPLARDFADRDALGSILWSLWVHYQTRTDFASAHRWLEELKAIAAENAGSDLPLIYDMSAGCQEFWEAKYDAALGHTDRLRSQYDAGRHARITALTNHDPLVFSQHWAGSLADWVSGRPDRSVERLDEAIGLARRIGHPFNLVFALTAGATSLFYLRDADRLLDHCDEAAEVAAEEALGSFSEHVNIMQWRGAAHVLRGEFEQGLDLARRGNDFWTASGGRICTAMFRGWIVLGLAGLGRSGEAAELNAANIAHCRETGDCYMEPECLRLAGELTLSAGGQAAEAERAFREAIALANASGALSWELRAAASLARLMQAQDRLAEGRATLDPVYARFAEGFATPDLSEAAALLEELG